MQEELEDMAQQFAEDLLELEQSARQETLEIFLDNLDSETRGMLTDIFEA